MDAKISFLNQTEKRMATEVTADVMAKVMAIVSDVMEEYEIRETFINIEKNDDLLDCYIDALKVQGRSEKTIERYRYVISKMMGKVKVPTRRITVYHLRSYLAAEQQRGLADSTTESIRQTLSAYFNWLQRESLIDKNPTANLGAIKCAKKKKLAFTDIEMYKLKAHCVKPRNKAVLMFLASTGCRVSEVSGLDRDAVDLQNMQCIVRGKGNKERTVFFDSVTAMALKEYLDQRKDLNQALFVTRYNKRMPPNAIRNMLNDLAKDAGVEHVHPHKFRRTLATDLARHGMPIQEVAHVLGHDKIDTTMKYVVQDDEAIKSAYKRYAM